MGDEPGQVIALAVSLEDDLQRFLLNIDRSTIGPDQRLLVYTDRRGIDDGLPVLGLGKQQYATAWTGSLHRGSNQRVPAYRQDHGIRASALAGSARDPGYVLPRRVNGQIQAKRGRNRVAFRVKIRRKDFSPRAFGQGRQHDADGALADYQDCLIRSQIQAADALQAGIQRFNEDRLGERNPVGDFDQSALHNPVHHPHIACKSTAGGLKACGAAYLLINRTLGKGFLSAVIARAARDVVENSYPVTDGK